MLTCSVVGAYIVWIPLKWTRIFEIVEVKDIGRWSPSVAVDRADRCPRLLQSRGGRLELYVTDGGDGGNSDFEVDSDLRVAVVEAGGRARIRLWMVKVPRAGFDEKGHDRRTQCKEERVCVCE